MIHSLFIGCNYPGTTYELPDCELDAQRLAKEFRPYCASATVLLSAKATRAGMLKAFTAVKAKFQPGDLALIGYSGHGTTDKVDGKLVQAIVPNDSILLYEFELRRMMADMGMAVLLADSCFSYGLARGQKHRPRSIPLSKCTSPDVKIPSRMAAGPHAFFAACKASETAASTGNGGAMTLAILEAFRERKDATSFASLAARVKKLLPSSEYPQHPQFTCNDAAFAKRTLKSFIAKGAK